MFPANDLLAEWAATLALAFNDISLVRARLRDDDSAQHRWFYWLRLGIAHFAEGASYLRDTSQISEVAAFIESLPDEAREHHADCIARYAKHETVIERIRNQAGFHYPELRIVCGQRRKRPMQTVLASLADRTGQVVGQTLGDARFLYADDIVSALVIRAHGGDAVLDATPEEHIATLAPVHVEIEEAISSLALFTNAVLATYFRGQIEAGCQWHRIE